MFFFLSICSSVLFAQQTEKLSDKQANRLATAVPVVLKSKVLTVTIDRSTGLPHHYLYQSSNIWGVDSAQKITAIVCRLKPRQYLTVPVVPKSIKATANQADLLFEVTDGGKPAASFHLKYALEDSGLIVTTERVSEQNGYELIEAALPNLATVREEDGPGWLAHGLDGGAVVDLQHAQPYHVPDDYTFGSIGYVLPVAAVGTSKAECVMEVSAFMDGNKMEITGRKGHRHARIGTVQVYRVHGGRAYNMNNGGPRVAGNEHTPNLIVGQPSRCRLDFSGDLDRNGSVDWLDGAKIVAKRMPPIPTTYFNDKFIYLIGGKYKPEKEPRTTFAQSEKLIRDIAMLTDYAPQIPLVSGWVYDGQDTGYPSEDKVNERLGGYEGLVHLMNEGPKYNANVSVNTNFDDAYKSSPLFDTAFLARQPDGKIWKSLAWAGEDSYIVGLAKYMQKWGNQRIDYLLDRYELRNTLLIDALSWYAIRNDWDPEHPASGYKNLVDGRYKVIDAFRKRGIDVISEHLRYPYIGKLAVSADGVGAGKCPFGGEPVPFVATIYRKSAIWGTGDFARNDVQKNLFWNCRSIQWYINTTDRSSITDFYYLTVLPFNKVHDKSVEHFERIGYRSIIGLGKDTKIEHDWMSQDYSVVVDGVPIAGHEATFCPIDTDRIAFYARKAKKLSAVLPAGWEAGSLVARALYEDRREGVPVQVEEGKITLSVPAGRPVIVYRNVAIADKKH